MLEYLLYSKKERTILPLTDDPSSNLLQKQKTKISHLISKIKKQNIKETLKVFYTNSKGFVREVLSKPTHYIMHVTVIGLSFFVSISTVYGSGSLDVNSSIVPELEKVSNKTVNSTVNPKTLATVAEITDAPVEIKEDVLRNNLPSLTSSFSFAGSNTIEKSVSFSVQEKGRDKVINYAVADGDTLWSVAKNFDITTNTIKWANNLPDENSIKPGQIIQILPISGTLHKVAGADDLVKVAVKYNASVSQIVEENGLLDETLKEGQILIIPGGSVWEPPKIQPKPQPQAPQRLASKNTQKFSSGKTVGYGRGGNKFAAGYCTSYVASRRNIPWRGNAGAWLGNARAMGYATGREPRAGAIIVTNESPVGHVGIVEAVHGGSVTISEMNYVGRGIVSRRTISSGSGAIRGFIY